MLGLDAFISCVVGRLSKSGSFSLVNELARLVALNSLPSLRLNLPIADVISTGCVALGIRWLGLPSEPPSEPPLNIAASLIGQ